MPGKLLTFLRWSFIWRAFEDYSIWLSPIYCRTFCHSIQQWSGFEQRTVCLYPCVFPGRWGAYVGMSLISSAGDRALLPLLSHICTVHGFAIMQQFSVAKTVIICRMHASVKLQSVFLSALPMFLSDWPKLVTIKWELDARYVFI